MNELTVEIVNNTVRPSFEKNVKYVDTFLQGEGYDMGCGSCPLLKDNCHHIDRSYQPLAIEQISGYENSSYETDDATVRKNTVLVDYVFSSHMVEDLPTKEAMRECLEVWGRLIKVGGFIVLLIPDMEGGRYPTIEEGGNCSHQINVGRRFFETLFEDISNLEIIQIDTIPHDQSETMDLVVVRKELMNET